MLFCCLIYLIPLVAIAIKINAANNNNVEETTSQFMVTPVAVVVVVLHQLPIPWEIGGIYILKSTTCKIILHVSSSVIWQGLTVSVL